MRRTGPTCKLVDEEATNEAADQANNGSDGDGGSWLAEGDTSNEDYSFHT